MCLSIYCYFVTYFTYIETSLPLYIKYTIFHGLIIYVFFLKIRKKPEKKRNKTSNNIIIKKTMNGKNINQYIDYIKDFFKECK